MQLSGGGVNITELLPVGYFNAHYLDNNAASNLYIATGLQLSENWELDIDFQNAVGGSSGNFVTIFGSNENYLQIRNYWQTSARVGIAGLTTSSLPFRSGRNVINISSGTYRLNNGEPYACSKGTNTVCSEALILKAGLTIQLFKVAANDGAGESRYFIPAIDPAGVPCMFDQVTKKPFYAAGTGTFIVGLTNEQAAKLVNLPAVGGTLSISLPSNWQEDSAVVEALSAAEEKGWVIDYRTFDAADAPATTFSLRRVLVRRFADEQGCYVDSAGSHWGEGVLGAEPETLGYEPYRSVEAAVAYWELEPWVDPEEENLLIEEEQTNE